MIWGQNTPEKVRKLGYIEKRVRLLLVMKLLVADKLWHNNNNCVTIIAFLQCLKSRDSVLLSYSNYAFITFKRRKHKSDYVYQARHFANFNPKPEKPGPTNNSATQFDCKSKTSPKQRKALGWFKKTFFPKYFAPRGLKGVLWCKNNPCNFFLDFN